MFSIKEYFKKKKEAKERKLIPLNKIKDFQTERDLTIYMRDKLKKEGKTFNYSFCYGIDGPSQHLKDFSFIDNEGAFYDVAIFKDFYDDTCRLTCVNIDKNNKFHKLMYLSKMQEGDELNQEVGKFVQSIYERKNGDLAKMDIAEDDFDKPIATNEKFDDEEKQSMQEFTHILDFIMTKNLFEEQEKTK